MFTLLLLACWAPLVPTPFLFWKMEVEGILGPLQGLGQFLLESDSVVPFEFRIGRLPTLAVKFWFISEMSYE